MCISVSENKTKTKQTIKNSVVTSEIHITSFTFPVISQELGKEQEEYKYKIPIYLNVVN